MSFQNTLAEIVESVDGCLACVLMGQDGLQIDAYTSPKLESSFDSHTFAVEYTGLLSQFMGINQAANFGTTKEMVLSSDKTVAVFRFITEDYFAILTLTSQANLGKARYLLRMCAPKLYQELA